MDLDLYSVSIYGRPPCPLEQPLEVLDENVKSPKSVELPVVAIVIYSRTLVVEELTPPPNTPLILLDIPDPEENIVVVSPKLDEFPVVAIVIYCITLFAVPKNIPIVELDKPINP